MVTAGDSLAGKMPAAVPYEGAALEKRAQFIAAQAEARALALGRPPTVLDLGCGLGAITRLLGARHYPVVGVDLDPATIAACRAHNRYPGVSFVVGDAATLDLPQRFDIVVASEVIEHVPHPAQMLRAMRRHLAPQGVGLISIPNGWCLWEIVVSRCLQKSRLVAWLYRSPHAHRALTGADDPFYSKNAFCFHVNFFSYGRFRRLLRENGLAAQAAENSDLGLLPEWSVFKPLKRLECRLARFVPHALAGGWLLVVRPVEEGVGHLCEG